MCRKHTQFKKPLPVGWQNGGIGVFWGLLGRRCTVLIPDRKIRRRPRFGATYGFRMISLFAPWIITGAPRRHSGGATSHTTHQHNPSPSSTPKSVQRCPAVKSVLFRIYFTYLFFLLPHTFSHGLNSVHLILYHFTLYATGSLVLYSIVLYRFVYTHERPNPMRARPCVHERVKVTGVRFSICTDCKETRLS